MPVEERNIGGDAYVSYDGGGVFVLRTNTHRIGIGVIAAMKLVEFIRNSLPGEFEDGKPPQTEG